MYIVDCKAGRSPAHEKKLKPINEGIKKMKKILAIMLIAVIAVAGVFAYTAPAATNVELNYVVKGIYQPAYKLHYDGNNDTANPSDTAAGFFNGDNDPIVVSSETQVTVDATDDDGGIAAGTAIFSLYDFTRVKSSVTNKLTLTVSLPAANAHWQNTTTNDYSTSLCTIGNVTLNTVTEVADGDNDNIKAVAYTSPASGDGVGVIVTYGKNESTDRSADANSKKIASFPVTWTADSTADVATYKTTLTVSVKTE